MLAQSLVIRMIGAIFLRVANGQKTKGALMKTTTEHPSYRTNANSIDNSDGSLFANFNDN
jgi:hypothetical protein